MHLPWFFLILLALVSGFFVSGMVVPRLGLSAHAIGLLSGALLIAIGAVWPAFALTELAETVVLALLGTVAVASFIAVALSQRGCDPGHPKYSDLTPLQP